MARTDDPDLRLIHALARRVFPGLALSCLQRADDGVSTHVYRIYHGADVFYLRVLPEEGASFVPEAHAHALLRARGVKVPAVVYVEHLDDALGRSMMVTSEIKGRHVGHLCASDAAREVLLAAGRDLAVINSIPVEGFGWIKRDRSDVTGLEAELPTYRAFALEHLDADLAVLGAHALRPARVAAILDVVAAHDAWLDVPEARLAHGDFDATHIYQDDGRYSRIIDFGEIRGADLYYDLGHFKGHDGETLSFPVLPHLLQGYREIVSLPPDAEQRIAFAGLFPTLRFVAQRLTRGIDDVYNHLALAALEMSVTELG